MDCGVPPTNGHTATYLRSINHMLMCCIYMTDAAVFAIVLRFKKNKSLSLLGCNDDKYMVMEFPAVTSETRKGITLLCFVWFQMMNIRHGYAHDIYFGTGTV